MGVDGGDLTVWDLNASRPEQKKKKKNTHSYPRSGDRE